MKNHLLIIFGAALGFLGCASEGPYVPSSPNPGVETQSPHMVVILDRELVPMVAVEGQEAEKTGRGYLVAKGNIRNRTNQDFQVQVQAVFRDARGFCIGDTSAWETLVLTANETRSLRIVSMSKKAERFTIRVRMSR
ncbi:MAG: DUF1425 domain-containing protein [Verrucomicrobiae bacterium]|nr:DUF1425 domain-containing protein [Verrucomicrobiae bacterium]